MEQPIVTYSEDIEKTKSEILKNNISIIKKQDINLIYTKKRNNMITNSYKAYNDTLNKIFKELSLIKESSILLVFLSISNKKMQI